MSNKRNYTKSNQLFEEAKKVIPGGVNSPVRAFGSVGGSPVFFEKGQGSVVTDADGNQYVDFCSSWGPLILGHAHPAVVEAATRAIHDGLTFGACSRREISLAKLVLEAFPEFEKIRFVSSGTEAVMTAVRLARGITGRSKLLKFEGCYHGHADHLLVKAGSGLITQPIASSAGVPAAIAGETLAIPLDDPQAVAEIFAKYKGEIAAVIIEPMPANSGLLEQRKEFLQYLRDITRENGTLLIFDEVISGLRLRFGGYMHEVNIRPDIVTLGKIVGGGMPVGALISSAANMDHLAPMGRVYQAGTLSGNPVAMAAGAATLEILRNPATYQTMEQLGQLQDAEFDRLKQKYPFFQSKRIGSVSWLYLDEGELPRRPDQVSEKAISRYNGYHRSMLDRGYYLAPSAWEVSFLSTVHTPEQIKGLAKAWDEVLSG